jgi:hypothetical protein
MVKSCEIDKIITIVGRVLVMVMDDDFAIPKESIALYAFYTEFSPNDAQGWNR